MSEQVAKNLKRKRESEMFGDDVHTKHRCCYGSGREGCRGRMGPMPGLGMKCPDIDWNKLENDIFGEEEKGQSRSSHRCLVPYASMMKKPVVGRKGGV